MRTNAAVLTATFLFVFAATAASDLPDTFGDPLPGLTPTQRSAFQDGLAEFTDIETVEDGLGPVFNGRSCGECHNVPVIGGGSERTEIRFGMLTNDVFDPLGQLGGSLIQDHAVGPADLAGIHQFTPDALPELATIVAPRRTTPVFGLGLVDAVPDADFYALAAEESARGDGTAGRVSIVTDLVHGGTSVGKFGWKAQVPNLEQFSGDAYLNEMGITNPLFPNENCPGGDCDELASNPEPVLNDDGHGVAAFADFMTMLGAPPRAPRQGNFTEGEEVFDQIGCASCHVANMKTGPSEIPALRHRPFHPYSDFLLHNMGSLGDGIAQGDASGSEMRTAPLWGLRMVTRFLHDGSATSIEEAILAHDGQGKGARDRFNALAAEDRSKLLEFLGSL